MPDAPPRPAREVTIVGAGGTIAMSGVHATPAHDADALVAAVPALGVRAGLEAESVRNLPGAALGLDGALAVALAAVAAANRGRGVVVTSGTDTIEELAILIDLMHGANAPIVVTGAIRPASAVGADGPANLVQAVAVAESSEAAGLGAVVVFGGQVHAARLEVRGHQPDSVLLAPNRPHRLR
jgi:L-asparaginase